MLPSNAVARKFACQKPKMCQSNAHVLVSWLNPSFTTEGLPCGFPFWPPQDIWVRKQCCHLRTAQNYSLLVQCKHSLSHLSAFLRRFLPRTLSTIFQVLGSDLSTCLREATCKEFFSYAKLMGDMAKWKWTGLSIKNVLAKRSNCGKIPFRGFRRASDTRRMPMHPLPAQALHQ